MSTSQQTNPSLNQVNAAETTVSLLVIKLKISMELITEKLSNDIHTRNYFRQLVLHYDYVFLLKRGIMMSSEYFACYTQLSIIRRAGFPRIISIYLPTLIRET